MVGVSQKVKQRAERASLLISGVLLLAAGWDALGKPLRVVTLVALLAGAAALGVALCRHVTRGRG